MRVTRLFTQPKSQIAPRELRGWLLQDASPGSREQLSITTTCTAQSLRLAVALHPRDRPPSSHCALGGSAEVARAPGRLGEWVVLGFCCGFFSLMPLHHFQKYISSIPSHSSRANRSGVLPTGKSTLQLLLLHAFPQLCKQFTGDFVNSRFV